MLRGERPPPKEPPHAHPEKIARRRVRRPRGGRRRRRPRRPRPHRERRRVPGQRRLRGREPERLDVRRGRRRRQRPGAQRDVRAPGCAVRLRHRPVQADRERRAEHRVHADRPGQGQLRLHRRGRRHQHLDARNRQRLRPVERVLHHRREPDQRVRLRPRLVRAARVPGRRHLAPGSRRRRHHPADHAPDDTADHPADDASHHSPDDTAVLRRAAGPRAGRLPARDLRQRLGLHPPRGRARQLGRHRPGLRRDQLADLGQHPLHPLLGRRVPLGRVGRRLQGRDQGQAGQGQEGAAVDRRRQRRGAADHDGRPRRLRLVGERHRRRLGPGRHRHRLRGPLAVAEHRRHRLQEPDHPGGRQPDLGAEVPQGPLRQRLRADDGAGDLLRADGLPVLRLRAVRRPGPALRRVPAGDLRPAQRPDAAARPGLQLRADHGPGQPVPHHGRRGLPHRDDRHAAHRLPGGGQHRQHVPGAGPLAGGDRAARLGQRGQRLHRPRRGRPGARLPDQEDQLRRLRHPRHLAGAARPDDVVGELGQIQQLGIQQQFPQLLRLTAG
ncbi:hypothetical protein SCOCK_340089 [Actinacidiphila cocklensis]|uniref:Uncharacterized protein n=1 Tax=Actinacidiphila cocklensis TaxID=887465 RepID=A0A9W4DQ95_9ACTN|nr:hypothetical protein SCOCK_340089 [Actinacidiphila cocklensis]